MTHRCEIQYGGTGKWRVSLDRERYGIESFEFSVLECVEDHQAQKAAEKAWIARLRPIYNGVWMVPGYPIDREPGGREKVAEYRSPPRSGQPAVQLGLLWQYPEPEYLKALPQPDPRAFVEAAIRQALDNQGRKGLIVDPREEINHRRQDIEDGFERVPFED